MVDLSTRDKIERVLEEERAMSFTKLKQETSLENGVLDYHVRRSGKLEKKKKAVVHAERCGECPLEDYCRETCVFKLLENKTRRKVLEMKAEGMRNSCIASELGLHRSTVTYHVSKLEEQGLLDEEALELLTSEDLL